MKSLESLDTHFDAALDLHETTILDVKLTHQRHDRNGEPRQDDLEIPPDYYLVLPPNPDPAFGKKIIDSVAKVTKITPDGDLDGDIIIDGIITVPAPGVLSNYMRKLANQSGTTEVNPDVISPEEALAGQLAAIDGVFEYVAEKRGITLDI